MSQVDQFGCYNEGNFKMRISKDLLVGFSGNYFIFNPDINNDNALINTFYEGGPIVTYQAKMFSLSLSNMYGENLYHPSYTKSITVDDRPTKRWVATINLFFTTKKKSLLRH